MDLGKIFVTLYKIGNAIRCGSELYDTIVTTADKAKEIVRSDVWEDHPEKAKFVALPDEEKAKCEKPAGLGLLTCIPGVNHAEEVAEQEKADAKAKAEADAKSKADKKDAPKADKKAVDNGDGNKG